MGSVGSEPCDLCPLVDHTCFASTLNIAMVMCKSVFAGPRHHATIRHFHISESTYYAREGPATREPHKPQTDMETIDFTRSGSAKREASKSRAVAPVLLSFAATGALKLLSFRALGRSARYTVTPVALHAKLPTVLFYHSAGSGKSR